MKPKSTKLTKAQKELCNNLRPLVKVSWSHKNRLSYDRYCCKLCDYFEIRITSMDTENNILSFELHFEREHQITDSQTAARVVKLLAFT